MANVQVRTSVESSEQASVATTAVSIGRTPSQHQIARSDADRVNHSLGKPSQKKTLKILDLLIVLVTWICLAIAVIAITPRLDVAWALRLQHQLQVIGLMLSIMSQCLQILAPKLWIIVEAWGSGPKLQNFDAIFRNSIMTSNAHLVWRALLLAFILLPIGLSLAYKVFVGGQSTHDFGNHTSWYGMTGAPGLTRNTVLKFGPSYMTNATLPFIMASADFETLPSFPQPYGFNNLVISNTSSAFLDAPLPSQVLPLQQSLHEDTTSTFTLTANVHATVTTYNHSIETSRDDDAFWDFYLDQSERNSTPDSFSSGISWIDLSSGKTLGILNNDQSDASWMILSFFQQSDHLKSPEVWIPAFRANAFLFNTRREICTATWHITYNAMQLTEGSCSVLSPLPNQDLLVNSNFAFDTYYMPSLAEYLAPLSTPSNATVTEQNVYEWGNQWLMSTFTTTIAGMYWSRLTALFGPDSYNGTLPAWNDEVNYTVPDALLSNRQTMNPSWALYAVLAIQPFLISLVFIASFILSHFSAIDGGNFGIIAILAGVRTETLRLFDGASFSGTLEKPVGIHIDTVTTRHEKKPQTEYSFYDDGIPPKPSLTATLRHRFMPSRFDSRQNTGYHKVDM
ncbi:MAG: hypothetical protein ASARMPREDX12_004506 [Alectoria sarmentosa]|nr:MAG: hypothetical protein ASARMPREDX12_004506 [Alectoria sarmentosa]